MQGLMRQPTSTPAQHRAFIDELRVEGCLRASRCHSCRLAVLPLRPTPAINFTRTTPALFGSNITLANPHSTFCWWTSATQPLTSAQAASSAASLNCHPLRTILPTSLLRERKCCPSPAPLKYHYSISPILARLPPPPHRIISVNCEGLRSKLPRIVALLLQCDPDVVSLQEVGSLPRDAFNG